MSLGMNSGMAPSRGATFRIEGDKLFIESAPAPSIVFPGKTDFRRIVWEREK
jgi:hypothetical protein